MKTALENISAGSFTTVIKRIQQKQLNLNANNALKLLIGCSTVCNKNQHRISIEDVCLFIRTCSSQIQELSETYQITYLQSLYHILKYLIEKDLSVVLQLEDALFPKFLHPELPEDQSHMCICLSSIIYNGVLVEVKQKNSLENPILTASLVSLKFVTKTGSAAQFLDRLHKLLKIFSMATVKFSALNDFMEKCMHILRGAFKGCKESDVVFRLFLSMISLFVRSFSETFTSEELQKFVNLLLTTCKEFCETKEHLVLLKITKVVCIFISNIPTATDLQNSYSNLKGTVQVFGLTQNVFALCQLTTAIFNRLCRCYDKNVAEDFWRENFTENLQLILYKLLRKTALLLEKRKVQCACAQECVIGSDVNSVVNLLYAVGYLFKLSLGKGVKSQELSKEALMCLEVSCTQILALKSVDCLNWRTLWLHTGSVFYNICVKLYGLNDGQVLSFYHVFIRFLIALEGTTTSMIKNNLLYTSLVCYIDMCIKMEDHARAMKMAAFSVFLNPQSCEQAFIRWINAKFAIDDDRNVTIVDMLTIAETDIKMLLPEFKLTRDAIEELLILELESYKVRWSSKVSMLSVFNKLYKCTSAAKAARVFVKIWGNHTNSVAENLTETLSKLIEDYENTMDSSDFESSLILGALYCCLYRFRMEGVVAKNSAELKEKVPLIVRPLPPYEGPPDPNDECDVVSLCQNLTCESQMKTKQFLDRSLEIFEKTCRDFCTEHLEFLKLFEICDILTYIGYEYQLHCYSENCQRLWKVVLYLAEKIGDDLLILKADTFLMEFSMLKATNYYLKLAQKILDGCENSAKKYEILINFYLTLSEKLLEAQNPHDAFKYFQVAQRFYENLLTFGENRLLKAKLLHVHFKLILLPCDLKIADHQKNSVVKIHMAWKIMLEYYRGAGRKQPNAIALLFEITYTIASWFRWMHLPRELRGYTRDVAIFAQQLVSPLWAARFLVQLAHADLFTHRIDDCRAKLLGISVILCIPDHQRLTLVNRVKAKGVDDWGVVNALSTDIGELCLDLPVSRKRVPACDLPVKSTFKLPVFLAHSSDCKKFCCQHRNYQELAVMQAHLEALGSTFTNESSREIQDYFEGALHLVEAFEKRAENPDDFWEIRATILLDYANIFLEADQIKPSEKINAELLALLSRKKLSNVYLNLAAVLQKSDILWDFAPKSEFFAKSDEDEDEGVAGTVGSPPRTPETRQNTVKIEQNSDPSPLPSPQLNSKKKLHFDFSGNTDKTPIKTPNLAVPIIKVYATETARKKRAATATKTKTSTKSLEATSCDSVKAEKLRSKTKLLTERIRKEAKEEGVSTRARKNLMGELGASKEEKNVGKKGGATKKSSRN